MERLIWTEPPSASPQQALRNNLTIGNDTEVAFALVFEAVLGLSDDPDAGNGTSNDWLESGLGTNVAPNAKPQVTCDSSPYYSSSMGRYFTYENTSRIEPERNLSVQNQHGLNLRSNFIGTPSTNMDPEANLTPQSTLAGGLRKSQLVEWMDAHALSRSTHHCAMYCRLGMESVGIGTGDRPRSGDAGDYGPFLLRHGAQVVPPDFYNPQVGDTVVFDKTEQHPSGHIEIFDGHQWVSDFMQHSFSPYRDASSTPPFTIYRLT